MTTSVKQYYEDIELAGLQADHPCDTSRVWTMVDNIAHLCESSPRYIVNMCSGVSTFGNVNAQARQREDTDFLAKLYFEYNFPVCALDVSKFPCWDIRLAASVTSNAATNTLYTKVAIGNALAAPPGGTSDPNVFGIVGGTTTSATPAWIIDDQIVSPTTSTMTGAVVSTITFQTGTDLVQSYYFYAKAMIELSCIVNDIADVIYLDGLQIREYPPA
jgi:hypothetical protein